MPNFTVTPTWVYPIEKKYNVMSTPDDRYKKDFYLLSSTPNQKFRLVFSGVTDDRFLNVIQNHWKDVSGTFSAFYWTSVPSYIDARNGSGVSVFGRWIGRPRWTPRERSWDVEMEFEVENRKAEPSVLAVEDYVYLATEANEYLKV